MAKSFKKQRRWEEYDDQDNVQQKKEMNQRRRDKKMKNDLRSFRNISTSNLQDYYEED